MAIKTPDRSHVLLFFGWILLWLLVVGAGPARGRGGKIFVCAILKGHPLNRDKNRTLVYQCFGIFRLSHLYLCRLLLDIRSVNIYRSISDLNNAE